MAKTPTDDAEYWRSRAEEARTLADGFTNPETKRVLYRVAESYDQLAEQAEERAKKKL